jgi:hypothetical protein
MKGARELKEKRKKEQDANVKRKEEAKDAAKRKARGEEEEPKEQDNNPMNKKNKKKGDDDSEGGSDVEGIDADDTANPEEKKRIFSNYQKKRIIPNISSGKVRAAGISKGMWKKELKT